MYTITHTQKSRQGQGLQADTLDARHIPCGSATMLHLTVLYLAWELLVLSQHGSMCRIIPLCHHFDGLQTYTFAAKHIHFEFATTPGVVFFCLFVFVFV